MSQMKATLSNLIHGNMSFAYGHAQSVIQNRLAIAKRDGYNIASGFAPKFGLGDDILVINGGEREIYQGKGIYNPPDIECDALITNLFDFPIIIPNADCYPVVLHCSEYGILAAAHGCRESLFQSLILKTVKKMGMEFGCRPQSITAYIFTGICEKCYILEYLNNIPEYLQKYVSKTEDGRFAVNLRRMIVSQLKLSGIKKIFFPNGKYYRDCTCHSRNGNGKPIYFSNYRNFHGAPEDKFLGNNALVIEMI